MELANHTKEEAWPGIQRQDLLQGLAADGPLTRLRLLGEVAADYQLKVTEF